MSPEQFQLSYFNQTTLHPLAILAMVILGLSVLLLPRRQAMFPFIAMACLISPAQRVIILTLNFDLLRIMVLLGTLRVVLKGEWRSFSWKPLDSALLAWAVLRFLLANLLYTDAATLKNTSGILYDALGMYFVFRMLVRDWRDLQQIAWGFIVVSVPVTLAFVYENRTGHNLFSIFGRVPEETIIRDGRLRCQGAFAHPILAGCFWAAQLPLFAVLWYRGGRWRLPAAVGIVDALVIIITCASSTPIAAVGLCGIGAAFYPLRQRMRPVLWSTVAVLAILHLSMSSPVWHLMSNLDLASGSTGWHRYHLIDEAINHWREWTFRGSTRGTAHWGAGLYDVTNQYIVEGLTGGLPVMGAFILMIAIAFRSLGQWLRQAADKPLQCQVAWALGVALFTHVANFMAVSYFGQILMIWYLGLAVIASFTPARQARRRAARPKYMLRPLPAQFLPHPAPTGLTMGASPS